jgi:hypothetical protein
MTSTGMPLHWGELNNPKLALFYWQLIVRPSAVMSLKTITLGLIADHLPHKGRSFINSVAKRVVDHGLRT